MELLFYLSLFALGAFDALQPGHAKALVSSALVGTNANIRQVLILGIVVTITHTLINSLLALGITFFAMRFFHEAFIRYVDIFAGASIVLIAMYLIWQRFFQSAKKCCHHHEHHSETSIEKQEMSLWQIIVLGFISGLSPCPVVLTALISAIAVGKGLEAIWGISVFSMGMGSVLMGVGCFTIYGMKKAQHKVLANPKHVQRFSQACALIVLFVGTFLMTKSLFFYQPEHELPMSLIFVEEPTR